MLCGSGPCRHHVCPAGISQQCWGWVRGCLRGVCVWVTWVGWGLVVGRFVHTWWGATGSCQAAEKRGQEAGKRPIYLSKGTDRKLLKNAAQWFLFHVHLRSFTPPNTGCSTCTSTVPPKHPGPCFAPKQSLPAWPTVQSCGQCRPLLAAMTPAPTQSMSMGVHCGVDLSTVCTWHQPGTNQPTTMPLTSE